MQCRSLTVTLHYRQPRNNRLYFGAAVLDFLVTRNSVYLRLRGNPVLRSLKKAFLFGNISVSPNKRRSQVLDAAPLGIFVIARCYALFGGEGIAVWEIIRAL